MKILSGHESSINSWLTRFIVAMVKPLSAENIYQDSMMYGYHNLFMLGANLDA